MTLVCPDWPKWNFISLLACSNFMVDILIQWKSSGLIRSSTSSSVAAQALLQDFSLFDMGTETSRQICRIVSWTWQWKYLLVFLAIAHLYSAFLQISCNKTLSIFRELASKPDSTIVAETMFKIKAEIFHKLIVLKSYCTISAEFLLLLNISIKQEHMKKVLSKTCILYLFSWWEQRQLSIWSHLIQIPHLF